MKNTGIYHCISFCLYLSAFIYLLSSRGHQGHLSTVSKCWWQLRTSRGAVNRIRKFFFPVGSAKDSWSPGLLVLTGGGNLLEDRVFSQSWIKENPFPFSTRCDYLMWITSPSAWNKAEIMWFLTRVFSGATGHLRGLNSCSLWALGKDDAVEAWGHSSLLPHWPMYHHRSVKVLQQPLTQTSSFQQAPYGLQTMQWPEECFNNI